MEITTLYQLWFGYDVKHKLQDPAQRLEQFADALWPACEALAEPNDLDIEWTTGTPIYGAQFKITTDKRELLQRIMAEVVPVLCQQFKIKIVK